MAEDVGPKGHWDATWGGVDPEEVSWFQPEPTVSVELVTKVSVASDSVVDVGGGASRLVDRLLERGFEDLTVVDIASGGMDASRARLGADAGRVAWVVADATRWQPGRTFDVWHDRAVFHFLVDDDARERYLATLRRAVAAGGHVVLATFGPEGPEMCSGLPVRRYDPAAMSEALGRRFELRESLEDVHVKPDGGTQQFVYGLFRAGPLDRS